MSDLLTLLRRGAAALVLATSLALAHGGPVQALACLGMSAAASNKMPEMHHGSGTHALNIAIDHNEHHQPVDQPTMAAAAPANAVTLSSGGSGGSPGARVAVSPDRQRFGCSRFVQRPSSPTVQRPICPDLVSVLCVNRP